MARIQTESGSRNVQTDTYKGRQIEIATGYDAISDKWQAHIYIDGQKLIGKLLCHSMNEAFDEAFRAAQAEIDQRAQF